MIIKSSTRGSRGLGAHLAAEENEVARVTAADGILVGDTESAVAELAAQGAASRTTTPLVHASISPDQPMSDEQWERAWSEWERARGLTGQPYLEVEHQKRGRVHRHRVYCRVDVDRGAVIRQSHELRVNERVARSLEAEFGHGMTPGRHSRAVQRWAQAHGDDALAQRVAAAAERDRPTAAMRHNQWQQAERTGVDPREIQAAAVEAWQQSDSPNALEAALAERGLALGQGKKTVQIIDRAGGTHDLRRALRQGGQRVRKADVQAMTPEQIAGVDEVREALRAAARTAAAAPESAVDHGGPGTETEGPQAEPAPAAASVTHESQPAEPATDLGTASEVSRIQQRLDEIDEELDAMPRRRRRDSMVQKARERAVREARTQERGKRSGRYMTLAQLERVAEQRRFEARQKRAAVDGFKWWQFRARGKQKKRAETAEQHADRIERMARRERERIEADPAYWEAQVDQALADYDRLEARRAALERERDELAERLDSIQALAAAADEHGPEQRRDSGAEPDLGPEPDDYGPEFRP